MDDKKIVEVISELMRTSQAHQHTEASVAEKFDKLSASLDTFTGRILEFVLQPVTVKPQIAVPRSAQVRSISCHETSWYSNPRKPFLLMVGVIVLIFLIFLLFGGFSFGRANGVFATVRKVFKNAETLGGYFPRLAHIWLNMRVDSTCGGIQLSDTSELVAGEVRVFYDFSFTSIISNKTPIRVIVTPTTNTIRGQLYVDTKNEYGFMVKELNGASAGTFDWLVIARRKGYEDIEPTPTPSSSVTPTPSESPEPTPEATMTH